QRRSVSDGGTFLHIRAPALPVAARLELTGRRRRARVGVVDEGDAVADEDVILDRHALADEGVARDLAAPSDRRVLLDFDERADLGLVADLAPIQVDELREPDI